MSDIKQYEPLWGAWHVEELIGEGSFGKVYKVRREEFGKTYYSAVKIISIPQNEGDVRQMKSEGLSDASVRSFFHSYVADITQEIDLMSEFRGNSNIVSFEDHKVIEKTGEIGWDILIRMELLESLTNRIEDGPLSHDEVVKLGIHICRALELCALHNTIHRDIKPDNIFVSHYGDYKLGDFGIARQIERTMSGLSKKGTYTYMAPEVYRGYEYGPSVDTYSLGIVMYRLLNQNRTPFLPNFPEPITPNDRDTALQRRMNGEPLSKIKGISPELNSIVLKACAYDRKERFTNPTDMCEALETVAGHRRYAPVAKDRLQSKAESLKMDISQDKAASARTQETASLLNTHTAATKFMKPDEAAIGSDSKAMNGSVAQAKSKEDYEKKDKKRNGISVWMQNSVWKSKKVRVATICLAAFIILAVCAIAGTNIYNNGRKGQEAGNQFALTGDMAKGAGTPMPSSTPELGAIIDSTIMPTNETVIGPTDTSTVAPTINPTIKPSGTATAMMTQEPTSAVTPFVDITPTPTEKQTLEPTASPTPKPAASPTIKPTTTPTQKPTATPTSKATPTPTLLSTEAPVQTLPIDAPTQTAIPTSKPMLETTAVTYIVSGKVTDTKTGMGIQGVTVSLFENDSDSPTQTVTSDGNGNFTFSGVVAGSRCYVSAQAASGDYAKSKKATIAPFPVNSNVNIVLSLDKLISITITGYLTDVYGKIVSGATVELFIGSWYSVLGKANTDNNGFYTLSADIPIEDMGGSFGFYVVINNNPNWLDNYSFTITSDNTTLRQDIRLEYDNNNTNQQANNNTTIIGYIGDQATNAVISGATVQISTTDGTVISTVTTDNTGYYSITNVPSGYYVLVASASGYKTATVNISVAGTQSRQDMRLQSQ